MLDLYYGLLWIGMLAGSLLLTALVAALAMRLKKIFWRRLYPILTSALISLFMAWFVTAAGILFFNDIQPKWLFWYSLALMLIYLTGSIFILRYGLAVKEIEEQKTRKWPRIKIAVAFIFSIVFTLIIFAHINSIIISKPDHVYSEVTKEINSMLPARVPASQNAYPLYEQASKALEANGKLPDWFIYSPSEFTRVPPHVFSSEVQAFVTKNQDALMLLHKALSMPHYWYEKNAEDIWFGESNIPNFSIYYRQIALLLRYSAIAKSSTGNLTGALQDLAAIETISEHIKCYPSLLPLMASIVVDMNGVSSLEYILATSSNLSVGVIKLPVKGHAMSAEETRKAFLFEFLGGLQMMSKYRVTSNYYDDLYLMRRDRDYYDYFKKYFSYPASHLTNSFFLYPAEIEPRMKLISEFSKPVKSYEELYHNTKIVLPGVVHYIDRVMSNDAEKD